MDSVRFDIIVLIYLYNAINLNLQLDCELQCFRIVSNLYFKNANEYIT